jgi:predicted Zn-dependent protease
MPLTRAADIPDNRVKIRIIGDDDFNAFVTNGEDIYVYTGLLKRIKSPDALQAVIAHELGHSIGGHMVLMADRMNAEMTRSLIMQALGIGLMAANPMAGAGVMAGASGVARQSVLSFSRDEERLADDTGLKLMQKAGLDPHGFIEVFEQMQSMTGAAETRVNPNNTNHPLTAERLKNVKEKIGKKKDEGRRTKDEGYQMIRAKLIGYLNTESQVAAIYPASDASSPALYARAIRYMQSGNLKAAKAATGALISRDGKNPYFYELLGDLEFQSGNYDDSVKAYEKSVELKSNAPQIQTALALVLAERNKPGDRDRDRAIELAKRALLREATPMAYWVLAKAYDQDGRTDWAMAEYWNMMKKPADAQKYAKAAQKKLKPDSPEYIKAGELLKK